MIDISKILFTDIFELYQLEISSENFQQFLVFISYPKSRIMFVKEGRLYVDNVVRKIIKDGYELAKIGLETSRDFYEEIAEYPNLKANTNDVVQLSYESGIPLSRLTHDYESIEDLPSSYINQLDSLYLKTRSITEYLEEKSILLPKNIEKTNNYTSLIRDFLKNELDKE